MAEQLPSQPSQLGISLELDPSVAQDLRLRDEERQIKREKKNKANFSQPQKQPLPQDEPANHGDSDELSSLAVPAGMGDEWDEVLLLPPHLQNKLLAAGSGGDDENDNEIEAEEPVDDDDDDNVSASPPPSLPVLWIDLERLVGYRPTTRHETDLLRQQIRQAVWGDDADDRLLDRNPLEQDTTTDIVVSREFEKRVSELLETGAARHGDTLQQQQDADDDSLWRICIAYPPYFCPLQNVSPKKDGSSAAAAAAAPDLLAETARLWKFLLQPHPIKVVHRVLRHLCRCNQVLSWKVALRREIAVLAAGQERERQRAELHQWQTQRRQAQLDQVYPVRQALQQRTESAQERVQQLERQRDAAVAMQLGRVRDEEQQQTTTTPLNAGGDALEAFAFDSFPTSGEMFSAAVSLVDEEEELGSNGGFNLMTYGEDDELVSEGRSNNFDDEDDSHRDDGNAEDAAKSMSSGNQDEGEKSLDSADERRKAAAKEEEARAAAEDKRRLEQQEEADRITEACTTPELRVAQAFLATLEERLERVDELIESLQDEEWAHQEEMEEQGKSATTASDANEKKLDQTTNTTATASFTLLDQILAMILGASNSPLRKSEQDTDQKRQQEHLEWLHAEHQAIVTEWKEYFGRLPPSLPLNGNAAPKSAGVAAESSSCNEEASVSSMDAKQRQASFGITGMETENWDNDDDEVGAPATTTQPPRQTGLRPGGTVG